MVSDNPIHTAEFSARYTLALLNPVRLMMAGTVSESRFNLFHPVAPVARTGAERRGGAHDMSALGH